jgi:hypothetical protein
MSITVNKDDLTFLFEGFIMDEYEHKGSYVINDDYLNYISGYLSFNEDEIKNIKKCFGFKMYNFVSYQHDYKNIGYFRFTASIEFNEKTFGVIGYFDGDFYIEGITLIITEILL